MSDRNQDDEEKRFKVIEVTSEDLNDAARRAGKGAWMLSDTWPGSAGAGRHPDTRSGEISSVVVTTTTVIRFTKRGDVEVDDDSGRPGHSSWFKADVWPGSDARPDNVGRGRAASHTGDRPNNGTAESGSPDSPPSHSESGKGSSDGEKS